MSISPSVQPDPLMNKFYKEKQMLDKLKGSRFMKTKVDPILNMSLPASPGPM